MPDLRPEPLAHRLIHLLAAHPGGLRVADCQHLLWRPPCYATLQSSLHSLRRKRIATSPAPGRFALCDTFRQAFTREEHLMPASHVFQLSVADRVCNVLRHTGKPLHYKAIADILGDVTFPRVLLACAALVRQGQLERTELNVYALPVEHRPPEFTLSLPERVLRAIAAAPGRECSVTTLATAIGKTPKYAASLCSLMVRDGRLVRRRDGVYARRPSSLP
jgi:hypothetical protein